MEGLYLKAAGGPVKRMMLAARRALHRYPELAYQEHRTAELIVAHLTKLKIPFRKGLGGTGVLGSMKFKSSGPVVALRADMDALPVAEATGLRFSSCHKGIMHACGHDGHVAALLGAAALLRKHPPEHVREVRLLFQPAEEAGAGALKMIEAGALEGVDRIFGGHIDLHYPTGEMAIRQGVETSYTDEITFRVTGRGGHAAYPQECVDAVVMASELVMDMQTIVSRNVSPLEPSVITIGMLQAGTVCNAIAETALLRGTIRHSHGPTRRRVIAKLKALARAVALRHGGKVEFTLSEGYPPVVNDPLCRRIALEAAGRVVGSQRVAEINKPSMGGEDFAFYLKHVPGCFVRFGAGGRDGRYRGLTSHSPGFDFDEEALPYAAAFLAEAAARPE